jgi:hypothetical protein
MGEAGYADGTAVGGRLVLSQEAIIKLRNVSQSLSVNRNGERR